MRAARALSAAAAMALALALVGGCAALPRSGPVGTATPELPAAQAADFYAGSPRDGASPEEIVTGFLNAQTAGYSDDFAVAREFLAAPVAGTWDPSVTAEVYADSGPPQVSTAQDGSITVSAEISGTLTRDGHYTEAASGVRSEKLFSLARTTAGQWRIVDLADGVLLSSSVFTTVFSAQPLYFFASDRGALVADLRWFPREEVTTDVVLALLAGPGAKFEQVVVTELPETLQPRTAAIDIADGIAEVDLSGELSVLPEPQRSLAALQIERTVFAVATVREVVISADGQRIEVSPEVASISSHPAATEPAAVAVAGGALTRLVDGEVSIAMTAGELGLPTPRHPATDYSSSGRNVALLDGTESLVYADVERRATSVVHVGEGLVAPSFDRHGWVWTAAADGSISALTRTGGHRTVAAGFLAGRSVRALAV